MTRNRSLLSVLIVATLILASVAVTHVVAGVASSEAVSSAPMNPRWIEYARNVASSSALEMTEEGHGLGERPAPVDLSHAKGQKVLSTKSKQVLALPSSYDLRTVTNKLPPVRNQGQCGSCWAFATYGSLESCLRPGETGWDFSEMDMNCSHGFDWASCAGANPWVSTAFLARWDGPVNESCYPYPGGSPYTCTSPRPSCARQKHVQEVIFLPDRGGSLDNDNIKNAVTTYGAVYTSMYFDNAYYNSSTYSYYYTGSSSNHGVCIVGWDDNYDKNKFSSVPAGNGAFIIRNSWGSSWGQSGYFYISYYDAIAGTTMAVFMNAESTTNYTRIYEYDPYGWVSDLGYGTTTAWCSNMFTAVATESLKAVSFYTNALNASYELYVYTGSTAGAPRSGTLATSKTGTIATIGYHTVPLSSSVTVTSGQKFSIVLKLTTPGYNYPLAYEYPVSGYCSAASANSGESYLSSNGTSWADLTGYSGFEEANVCIKGFIGGDTTPPIVNAVQVQTSLTVDITFSEAMGTGVTTAANYTVSGTGMGTLAGNPNSVALVSGNRYRLTWTSGEMKNGGDITICTANVQDLAGNTIGSPNCGTHAGGGIGSAPTVAINQGGGQADPTSTAPINFTAVFSEPVTGFIGTDVSISGTAGGTKVANVTGGPTIFNVAVSGMTTAGTVIATIAAGVCTDLAGNSNAASTSIDNSMLFGPDSDGDGVIDILDNCPNLPNPDQMDADSDGVGNVCDNCPATANPDQQDTDNDGMGNACDGCPNDPNKIVPGICGCGVADTDSDSDGTPDCNDGCPNDPNKIAPGQCGCGNPDTDSDADGVADCNDNCPNVPNSGQEDSDGDGCGDACDAPAPQITAWKSERMHGGTAGALAITLSASGTPKSEPRRDGIKKILVTFDSAVEAADGNLDVGDVTVTDSLSNTYTPTSVGLLNGGLILTIEFDSGLPDMKRYTIELNGKLKGVAPCYDLLAGDTNCDIRGLVGDANNTGDLNLIDVGSIKARAGTAVTTATCMYDLNYDGNINLIDVGLAKSRYGNTVP